jgi:hypothetical protein
MSAEKGVSPGTVELDPRAEETQETMARPMAASGPRSEAASRPADVEIIEPAATGVERRTTGAGEPAPVEAEPPSDGTANTPGKGSDA